MSNGNLLPGNKSMLVRLTPADSSVTLKDDANLKVEGYYTGNENIYRINLDGFHDGWGAVLAVRREGYKDLDIRGVLRLGDNPDTGFITADTFTLEPKPSFRQGLVRPVGRSFADDTGPFHPLGCTFFWALRGWKDEPSRVRENLEYLKVHGYDYVRILGDVAWASDLEVNSDWPDYIDIAQNFIYTARNEYGLRTEITLYGGGPRDVWSIANKLIEATKDQQDSVIHWEVSNEYYKNGPDVVTLMNVGNYLLDKTPNLVALSAPPDAVPEIAEDMSENFTNANLISMHWVRNYGDDDWRFVRQGWDARDSAYPYSNNEGKGPLSSVSSCIDPLRLACYRAVSVMCGSGLFVLHNGAGIYGVPNGDRPANLWEIPNANEIHYAVRKVDTYFNPGIENWQRANDGWTSPLPVNPIHCTEWTNDVGPIKNYSAVNGRYFMAIPHGIKNHFSYELKNDVKFNIIEPLTQQIVQSSEGSAGSFGTINVDDTRNNALIFVGEYL